MPLPPLLLAGTVSMLNPKALTALNEIIRRGSLRRAARHLNLDPSAVSRQIKQLEEEVGVALCERSETGMRATQAGVLLLDHFHRQQAAEAAALSQLSALQGLRSGEVRIAVGEGFIADLISLPLQSFMARHPGIEVVVRMAGVNEATELLRDFEVDIALLYAPPVDPILCCHVETCQPLDLIVPAEHPLLEIAEPLTLSQVAQWPLALIDECTGMRQMVNQAAQQERVSLRAQLRTNSVSVLKNFVRSGIGVTFMPELSVVEELRRGDICLLPMQHPALATTRAQMCTRRGREMTVAVEACVTHLQQGLRFFTADAPRLLGK
ncbi:MULTISPECIES: LysR family transcriptional regulator [Cobetia]|uniref:LysR family transcriptional regulator n=1 Tax=Cobetia amphilecti TaxID=1055104 RepID=A0AAP4TWK6_9GAMM|nr:MULTISPECIES: LysR family transcriptional regulator [Cobetia]MDH2297714.1 LysR family transcriptional regulator [Cobetia sp. 29-18-1]MDH2420141.1 LysR family transcriptional regulator [Cobetia litoralis]MDH2422462.1 LysR family transcriptional regulator [Cobetia litoralis]MDO6671685.1 LysR family transcriptional regulator [Cobetia amphilecti]MDO6814374.1 LysR family transcriptional regulator [Cobetia amphilecti]